MKICSIQPLFSADPRKYGLPNQIDYFLFRAEQERTIREAPHIGLTDGGLDLDYFLFARLFHQKGYLDAREFELCKRLYFTLRASLPSPDIFINLQVPLDVLEARWRQRARQIDAEISTIDDLPVLQEFLDEYLGQVHPHSLITLNATEDIQLEELTLQIEKRLRTGPQGLWTLDY